MQLATIPRASVKLLLCTARLPISTVERIVGRDEVRAWPPTLAFDGLAGSVEQVVGSLLRDDELEEHGRLEQTRVAELRDAARLETLAEQVEDEATRTYRQRRKADERKRGEATDRAQQREAAAERDRRQSASAVEAKTDERRAQVREAKHERDASLEKKERKARQESVAKERQAVEKAKDAADAKTQALEADEKVRSTKARRNA